MGRSVKLNTSDSKMQHFIQLVMTEYRGTVEEGVLAQLHMVLKLNRIEAEQRIRKDSGATAMMLRFEEYMHDHHSTRDREENQNLEARIWVVLKAGKVEQDDWNDWRP